MTNKQERQKKNNATVMYRDGEPTNAVQQAQTHGVKN